MSNKQQTAVEWLIKKITNRQNGVFDGLPHLSLDEIFEQAKELEKQQIIDANVSGYNNGILVIPNNAEQYYKDTYGE